MGLADPRGVGTRPLDLSHFPAGVFEGDGESTLVRGSASILGYDDRPEHRPRLVPHLTPEEGNRLGFGIAHPRTERHFAQETQRRPQGAAGDHPEPALRQPDPDRDRRVPAFADRPRTARLIWEGAAD